MRGVDGVYLVHCQTRCRGTLRGSPSALLSFAPEQPNKERFVLRLFVITGSPRVLAFWRSACGEWELGERVSRRLVTYRCRRGQLFRET